MKEVVKRSLVKDIGRAISILEKRETSDLEQLKDLSDHTIKDESRRCFFLGVHRDSFISWYSQYWTN